MPVVTREKLEALIATRKPPPEPEKKLNGNGRHSALGAYLDSAKDADYPPVMTEELLQKVKDALAVLDPDDTRGGKPRVDLNNPKGTWLRIVLAVASLQSDEAKEELRTWSKRSDKYDEFEFNRAYDIYETNHASPIRVGTLFKFAEAKKQAEQNNRSPREILLSMSSTGKSEEMRKRMADDKFIIKGLAINGQNTAIYAPPNAGKTLIVMHGLTEAVKDGVIEGSNIIYVNADDHGRGAVDKVALCEPHNIQMLIPNENGFESRFLLPLMCAMIKKDEARETIIVLDTAKKFMDLMDKKDSSKFGTLAREFSQAGGSVIALAHTNKRRDNGELVYGGTSDVVDDFDCMYIFDTVGVQDGIHTVEATNKKARGDVSSTLSYQFTRVLGQTYAELLDSVKPLDNVQLMFAKETEAVRHRLEENAPVIQVIQKHIPANNRLTVPRTKGELIEHIAMAAEIGQKKVRKVMDYHEGDDYDKGYRWTSIKVGNERTEYKLLDPPSGS